MIFPFQWAYVLTFCHCIQQGADKFSSVAVISITFKSTVLTNYMSIPCIPMEKVKYFGLKILETDLYMISLMCSNAHKIKKKINKLNIFSFNPTLLISMVP